MPTVPMKFIE